MKHSISSFILTCIFCLLSHFLVAQQLNNQYTNTPPIQQFIEQQDAYWETQIDLYGEEALLEEGSNYSQYLRWKEYTLKRVSLDGNLSEYQAQLEYLCENPLPVEEGSGVWTEMGPIAMPDESIMDDIACGENGIGPVNFVSLSPNYSTSGLMFTGGWHCGLFYRDNQNPVWKQTGAACLGGHISSSDCKASPIDEDTWFMCDGNGDGLFMNGPLGGQVRSQGVYRTMDRGETWELICDAVVDLGASEWEFQINRILIIKQNLSADIRVFIATSKGVYMSDDAMEATVTWELVLGLDDVEQTDAPAGYYLSEVSYYDLDFISTGTADCPNCGKVVATASKLYLPNGASKSGVICGGLNGTVFTSLFISDPTNPNNIGVSGSWDILPISTALHDYSRLAVSYSPDDEDNFYIHATDCSAAKIFRYNINNEIDSPLGSVVAWGGYGSLMSGDAFVVSPTDAQKMFVIDGTSPGCSKSVDGGLSFSNIGNSNKYHDDVEDAIVTPDGQTLFLATHGGIYSMNTSLGTWQPVLQGLGVAEVMGFSNQNYREQKMNIGLFHQGTMSANSYTTLDQNEMNWKQVDGGDGNKALVPNSSSTIAYEGVGWSSVFKNTDNYTAQVQFCSGNTAGTYLSFGGTYKNGQMALNPFDDKIIYCESDNIYRHDNRGSSTSSEWVKISDFGALIPWLALNPGSPMAYGIYPSQTNKSLLFASVLNGNSGHYYLTVCNKATSDASVAQSNWAVIPWPTGFPYQNGAWASTIVSDANNPNIFYVLTGVHGNWQIVRYTYQGNILTDQFNSNSAFTIEDISFNFPNIHASDMHINRGTDDIWIGTDLGVYHSHISTIVANIGNSSAQVWQQYGIELPNANVTKLDVNFHQNKLRAATNGRGVWQNDLPCAKIEEPIYVSTNKTWDAPYYRFRQDVIVNAGATLTITSQHVYFATNCNLVVKPGGKVVVDGGVLTNSCPDEYWGGIEVWGQTSERQLANLQGTLELKNGAIIEHAGCGVRLGHLVSTAPWTYDWGKTGGIVRTSTNSVFRNNRKDVEFLAYQNYYILNGDTIPKKNLSFFNDTEFLVDEVLPSVANLSQRISLFDVDGIRFRSCNFHIEGDALTNYSIQNRGHGIYSLASSFVVNGRCSQYVPLGSECDPGYLTAETLGEPDSDILPSRFSNYLLAIRSIGGDGFANTSVSSTIFTDNQYGIFLKAIDDASIYRNRFFVTEQNHPWPIAYGVSLLECNGYELERNIFEGTGDLTEWNTGAWITNSPNNSNEIYLNDFIGLYGGSMAQGVQAGGTSNLQGLEMLCGLYENTKYNLAVSKTSQEPGIIALRQGDDADGVDDFTAPAGNLFTQTNWGTTEPFTDYFICPDGDCAPVIYEHHNESSAWPVVPVQIDDELVELSPNEPEFITREDACPVGHGIVHTPSHLHSLVVVKRLEIENIKGELQGLIDGGNTATMQAFVNDANNSSANVRSNLLPLTPYLSDDVLHDLIVRQPAMNPWHLCEILIACSPLSPTIFDEVDNSNQLSEFLFGLLKAYQSGTNGLVSKETLLKQRELEKANALSSFIRTRIVEDEENYYLEEVKELMTGDEINREIKKKVAIYRQEKNHAAANALLADYNEDPATDVWKQVMTVLLDIDAAGGYGAATSSHIATLETLALSGKEGCHHASALLEILTGVQPDEELNLPHGGLKSLKVKDMVRRPSLVGVYPNPAQGEFYITYVLPTERESAFIHVYDLQGKLVHSENITSSFGILSLNAKHFAAGSYVFELELNGQKVATEKFQIVE